MRLDAWGKGRRRKGRLEEKVNRGERGGRERGGSREELVLLRAIHRRIWRPGVKSGVIDPAKVPGCGRMRRRFAAMMLTTEALVAGHPRKPKKKVSASRLVNGRRGPGRPWAAEDCTKLLSHPT